MFKWWAIKHKLIKDPKVRITETIVGIDGSGNNVVDAEIILLNGFELIIREYSLKGNMPYHNIDYIDFSLWKNGICGSDDMLKMAFGSFNIKQIFGRHREKIVIKDCCPGDIRLIINTLTKASDKYDFKTRSPQYGKTKVTEI